MRKSWGWRPPKLNGMSNYSTDNPFDPTQWRTVEGFEDLTDITYQIGRASCREGV